MKIVVSYGIKKTAELLAKETAKAKKIDWGMTKSFYIDDKIVKSCQQAVKMGVDERLLGVINKKTLPLVKKYLALGVKVKNIPLGEFKFGVRDEILTRFWISRGESIFCLWIYDKKINRHFRKMYEKLWEKAEQY
jgi:hypothetical protein